MHLFSRGSALRRAVTPSAPSAPPVPSTPRASPPPGKRDTSLTSLTGEWVIDQAHSRIGFSVRHAMVSTVRGAFNEYDSRLYFDGFDPARSRAEIVLYTASVDTGVGQRDAHLMGRDFLDAETYPRMHFASTAVEVAAPDVFRMAGDLTIRDITQPIVIEMTYIGHVSDPFGYQRAGFDGTTTINRSDWGLTYDAKLAEGGAMVSEKVRLQFDIAAIRTAPAD